MSSRIESTNRVRSYPDNDKEVPALLDIRNHTIFRDRVVIKIDKTDHVFIGQDLILAIQNAMNTH